MACFPSANKCEWHELQHFVAHYNEVCGTNYRRKECLDRNNEAAQPEVLCEDPSTSKTVVIERKSLVWPLDYVKQHKRDHAFYDALGSNLSEMTKDHPFELRVDTPPRGNVIELERVAQQLSEALKLHIPIMEEGTRVVIREPVAAILIKERLGDRDYEAQETGLVFTQSVPEPIELEDPANVPAEFVEKIASYLASLRKKFSEYEESEKVFLINIVSPILYWQCDGDWWASYFRIHPGSVHVELTRVWG